MGFFTSRFYHWFMCSESWYHMITRMAYVGPNTSVPYMEVIFHNTWTADAIFTYSILSVPNLWSHQKCNGQSKQWSHSDFWGLRSLVLVKEYCDVHGEILNFLWMPTLNVLHIWTRYLLAIINHQFLNSNTSWHQFHTSQNMHIAMNNNNKCYLATTATTGSQKAGFHVTAWPKLFRKINVIFWHYRILHTSTI